MDTPKRVFRKKLTPEAISELVNSSFVDDLLEEADSDIESKDSSDSNFEISENNNYSDGESSDDSLEATDVCDDTNTEHTGEEEVMSCNGADDENTDSDWHDLQGNQKQIPFVGEEDLRLPFDPATATPLDYLNLFWTEDLITYMVTETNKNAEEVLLSTRAKRSSRYNQWIPTNNGEMKKYLALRLWMGLMPLPHYADYWSKKLIYKNFVAKSVMTRDRFFLLTRFWHFSSSSDKDKGRLHKIQPLVSQLITRFKEIKTPGMKLAIDESMVPWRGRLVFRQYLPNKSHKYGIKIFKICDENGFTYDMIIYSGKGTVAVGKDESMPAKVVKELVKDYLDCGRVICTDNYYTSLELCHFLLDRNTHFVGIARKNRKGFPKSVTGAKLNKRGDIRAQENSDGMKIAMVVVKWKDQREVLLLSTVYGPEEVLTGKRNWKGQPVKKPEIVVEYNKAKGGIDISDTLKSYHSVQRKTIRWYHKVADDLLFGTCIVNALLLQIGATGNSISLKTFREKVVESLLEIPADPIQRTPNPSNHYLQDCKVSEGKDMRYIIVREMTAKEKVAR